MNAQHHASDGDMRHLLDRLVCDELDEPARTRVLAWLDEDTRRWRSCALAFLEAQAWSRSLASSEPPPERTNASPRRVEIALEPAGRESLSRHGTGRRAASIAGVALCLLLAFGLGATLREIAAPAETSQAPADSNADQPGDAAPNDAPETPADPDTPGTHSEQASGRPLLASVSMRSESGIGRATTVHIPVTPVADGGSETVSQAAEIPEYVRKQWERRGIHFDRQRRYLFATLPSGESVVVPVERLHVKHVESEIQ